MYFFRSPQRALLNTAIDDVDALRDLERESLAVDALVERGVMKHDLRFVSARIDDLCAERKMFLLVDEEIELVERRVRHFRLELEHDAAIGHACPLEIKSLTERADPE